MVQEPNSESCLDLTSVPSPCEKVVIVPDTYYITSAIRKFMLDWASKFKKFPEISIFMNFTLQ